MSTQCPAISSTPSRIAQTLMVKLNELPLEQQQEVLDFIKFLIQKNTSRNSIWTEIEEIVQQVPEESWDCLPTDDAQQDDRSANP